MRTFEYDMFASRLHSVVNNQNRDTINLNCVFYSYIKKNINYGLVIILRLGFCH